MVNMVVHLSPNSIEVHLIYLIKSNVHLPENKAIEPPTPCQHLQFEALQLLVLLNPAVEHPEVSSRGLFTAATNGTSEKVADVWENEIWLNDE